MFVSRIRDVNNVSFRRTLSMFYRDLSEAQRRAISQMFFQMTGNFFWNGNDLVFGVTVDHIDGVATDIELVTKEHFVTVNNIYQLYGIAGVVAWAYRKRGLPIPTDPGYTSYLMAEKKLIEWEKP